jgi:hypothetical protein
MGERIISKYLELGIQNINIVFGNSPIGRQIEPLVVHFVPRVNMTALYEIRGVNVVDTPPENIAVEFRRHTADGQESINWSNIVRSLTDYNPNDDFESSIMSPKLKRKK